MQGHMKLNNPRVSGPNPPSRSTPVWSCDENRRDRKYWSIVRGECWWCSVWQIWVFGTASVTKSSTLTVFGANEFPSDNNRNPRSAPVSIPAPAALAAPVPGGNAIVWPFCGLSPLSCHFISFYSITPFCAECSREQRFVIEIWSPWMRSRRNFSQTQPQSSIKLHRVWLYTYVSTHIYAYIDKFKSRALHFCQLFIFLFAN